MNLDKASNVFGVGTTCFLVEDEEGELVSFSGIPCCYRGEGYAEDLLVCRVVDIETMEILWDDSMPEPDDPPTPPICYPPTLNRSTTVTFHDAEYFDRLANPGTSAVNFDGITEPSEGPDSADP